jgi:molybdopterin synthase sulfur carrier subunit
MSVTLTLPTVLARLAGGRRSIESEGSTVGDVIQEISGKYPELAPRLRSDTGEQYAFVTIYLNDEDIRFAGGFAADVKDGDEVAVVPAIAGG